MREPFLTNLELDGPASVFRPADATGRRNEIEADAEAALRQRLAAERAAMEAMLYSCVCVERRVSSI